MSANLAEDVRSSFTFVQARGEGDRLLLGHGSIEKAAAWVLHKMMMCGEGAVMVSYLG